MLPYFLGCPIWRESAWLGSVYPSGLSGSAMLAAYARSFNAVEGNTTLYAWPSAPTVARWAEQMPETFHFCAKFPKEISHGQDLREAMALVERFVDLLRPLGERVSPFWLQLPARFGPERLPELAALIQHFPQPLAVEVRHLAFFSRGDEERALNRLLRDHGVERICLDSRALFDCHSALPAVRHAQTHKPRLPVRPADFSGAPQVRFIGQSDLAANDRFLAAWVEKVAGWIEAGKAPHVFLHTPDNHLAPQLALRFHRQLQVRLPGLADLALATRAEDRQLDLLSGAD